VVLLSLFDGLVVFLCVMVVLEGDRSGTAGRIAFDDTHDLRYGPGYAQVMFVQWQEGGKRAIVWPKERADGKFVLPAMAKK